MEWKTILDTMSVVEEAEISWHSTEKWLKHLPSRTTTNQMKNIDISTQPTGDHLYPIPVKPWVGIIGNYCLLSTAGLRVNCLEQCEAKQHVDQLIWSTFLTVLVIQSCCVLISRPDNYSSSHTAQSKINRSCKCSPYMKEAAHLVSTLDRRLYDSAPSSSARSVVRLAEKILGEWETNFDLL